VKKRPKLILIDDNPDFGGHQVMTAYGLEGILTYGDWEVLALLDPGNDFVVFFRFAQTAQFPDNRRNIPTGG